MTTKDMQVIIVTSNPKVVRYITHTSAYKKVQKTQWKKHKSDRYYFVATFRRDSMVVASRWVFADELTGGNPGIF